MLCTLVGFYEVGVIGKYLSMSFKRFFELHLNIRRWYSILIFVISWEAENISPPSYVLLLVYTGLHLLINTQAEPRLT